MARVMSAFIAEPGTYVYTILVVAITYYVWSSVGAYWRLRAFKGPPVAAWTELWWIWAAISGNAHLHLSDVNTKYGSIARIGPNTLVTSDPELFKKINNPRSGYRRSEWYKAFRLGADQENVISETDNDARLDLRNRAAPAFSGRDQPDFEATIDAVMLSLFKSWEKHYLSKDKTDIRPMDLAFQVQYVTLDVITGLFFGEPFGWAATNSDVHEYVKTINDNFPIMNLMSVVPLFSHILRIPWIQRQLSPSVKDRAGMGRIKAVSSDIIARRIKERVDQKNSIAKNDMVSSLLAHGFDQDGAVAAALIAILAGSETVATVARSGLVFILTQPRILRKLRAECDGANVPVDQVVSRARSLELPYLQACCKESLRFHPAATGLLPRIVPPQGDYHNGHFIPGGTVVTQCGWNIQRLNYATYGSDANFFRPERWLEATKSAAMGDSDRLRRMEDTLELAFSYGGSKCLGQRIALHELPKIIFEFVRRYEFNFVDGMKTMATSINYGLFHQEGMWVTVEKRADMSDD